MITSFPANQLANMAGLQYFSFSPYQAVANIPPPYNKQINAPVTFTAGSGFLLGYSTIGQLQFTEKWVDDDQGGLANWLITGYAPGDSDVLQQLMEDMRYSKHLVVTADHNQVLRLVGINAPLQFSADFDSGAVQGSDAKGYTFTFSGQSRFRAPKYNFRTIPV